MTSARDRSVTLRIMSRTVDAEVMPPQQPTPRPLGQKDAAVLIGLLAVIESELAGKNVEPYLVTAMVRRFQHEGLIPKKAGSPDLRAVLAELNQRLRVAHGEPIELGELEELDSDEPDDEVVPEPEPVSDTSPEPSTPLVAAPEEPAADEPAPQQPAAEDEPADVAAPEPPRQLWRKPKTSE